jgi:hypothetical protein
LAPKSFDARDGGGSQYESGTLEHEFAGRRAAVAASGRACYGRDMKKGFTVTATWDAEAGVFTSQSDIPGLAVEAETFEELVELVRALAPDVIATNLPSAPRPYILNIETRRELAVA